MHISVTRLDQTCRSWDSLRRAAFFLAAGSLLIVTSAYPQSVSKPGTSPDMGRGAAVQQVRRSQDALNSQGVTALVAAASAGDVSGIKSLLAGGASVDAVDGSGRTALIAAIQRGQPEAAKALIDAGANLNLEARYIGSPLNVAENAGDTGLAAYLIASGAHSTGKSVGDSVCVQPWGGEGYCGTVRSFTVRDVQLDVTRIVGCAGGCPAHPECSSRNPVGGTNGLHIGEQIAVPSWCLTRTGVIKAEASSAAGSKTAVIQ